jgi:hypothetical protein
VKLKHNHAYISNGYVLVYDPCNPYARDGWIYEHIKVASASLGRPLRKSEVVHHLDGNRMNNRLGNLLVMLKSQHIKLHMYMDRVSSGRAKTFKRSNKTCCAACGCTLQLKQEVACSSNCLSILKAEKSKRPSKQKLRADLHSGLSWLALGRQYGVSDNAVRKWARSYNLIT